VGGLFHCLCFSCRRRPSHIIVCRSWDRPSLKWPGLGLGLRNTGATSDAECVAGQFRRAVRQPFAAGTVPFFS
jgi:hypothetical protein